MEARRTSVVVHPFKGAAGIAVDAAEIRVTGLAKGGVADREWMAVDRDGLLLSCSCSYHLEPGELTDAVQRAVRHLGRFAQLIGVGAQAPDHPVHPAIDETRYLRAFLFRVTDSC